MHSITLNQNWKKVRVTLDPPQKGPSRKGKKPINIYLNYINSILHVIRVSTRVLYCTRGFMRMRRELSGMICIKTYSATVDEP